VPPPEGPMRATNAPSATVQSRPSSTDREPFQVGYAGPRSVTVSFGPIVPPDHGTPLEPPHQAVQPQADDAHDGHPGHDQVRPVSGVAGSEDQEPAPGMDGDQLGGHHDQPGDPKADPHADDHLGQGGKNDTHASARETAHSEVLGGPQILRFDGMDTGGCRHHHGAARREEDEHDGGAVSHSEPKYG